MLVSLIINGCGWLDLVLQDLVRADTGNVVPKRALLAMRLWFNYPVLFDFKSMPSAEERKTDGALQIHGRHSPVVPIFYLIMGIGTRAFVISTRR